MLTLSAAPRWALLHSFIPLRELRSSFSWCWGFRNGTILPFVFYCNILMLLLSGLLRGIFHSPLQSLCLGMRKHSQEYSALPEGIFLFSQVGGKNVKPELLLLNSHVEYGLYRHSLLDYCQPNHNPAPLSARDDCPGFIWYKGEPR